MEWKLTSGLRVALCRYGSSLRGLLATVACGVLLSTCCWAESTTVRVRLAWGSGDGAKHRWFGTITCADASFIDLQPLGIESDASAAIRIAGHQLLVDPLEKRGFDGCDVTVTADIGSTVRIELSADQSKTPTIVEVPFKSIIDGQVRHPIDSLESFILAYRCPGDQFRVVSTRESLIFQPGESWPLLLLLDLKKELLLGPVVVDAKLHNGTNSQVAWQFSKTLTSDSPQEEPLAFDVVCPEIEGAYRLTLTARPEESFTTRLVPGQKSKPYATREIDLVVVDPQAKLPLLTDHWIPILSIDPANPSWWQRLPSWAQVTRLSGKPQGSIGNVRLVTRESDVNGLVELPPATQSGEPSWQAFTLPVLEVGVPHLVEITYPMNLRQLLDISVIEPDAAGRVNTSVLNSSLYVDEVIAGDESQLSTHRIVFWPRTRIPQLLVSNRHHTLPSVFGTIKLSRHDNATSSLATQTYAGMPSGRFLAGYIAKPVFAQNFGAAEQLDPSSGMSVQSWSTFLDGARRLTQFLHLSGYNSVFASVAADGSALFPSDILLPSPRYDTGLLAASGQDPKRKDVLELLLRVCDREAVRLVPTLQLDSPLARLEELRSSAAPQESGITCVDAHGQEYRGIVTEGLDPQFGYNLLNEQVQQEVLALVIQLAQRSSEHSAFSGIGLQLASTGYAMLPGLEWGFDDNTCAAFSEATGVSLPMTGENRFRERAAILLGEQQAVWQAWRVQRLTKFYSSIQKQVQSRRSDAQVFLLTEGLFEASSMQRAVRQSMSNPGRLTQLLAERGIDLNQLSAISGVELTSSLQQSSHESLQEQVSTMVLNELAMKGELLPAERRTTDQVFHSVSHTHLPSFDAQSPFGKEATHLVLANQILPAGAQRDYYLTSALASRPLPNFLVGGDFMPMTLDRQRQSLLRTMEQLPERYTESRTLQKQPVQLRIQRTSDATYLICINESPWKVELEASLKLKTASKWQLLGTEALSAERSDSTGAGILPQGASAWKMSLDSYGLQAWKIESPDLEVDQLRMMDDGIMREYLEQRIAAIQDRTGNLNIVRDYRQLQNPGFEVDEGTTRIFGWQVRKGPQGKVAVESDQPHTGEFALRLQSEDRIGVAVQSHLFPIPETGQLVLGAYFRPRQFASDSQFVMSVESEDDGRTYRRFKKISATDLSVNQWTRFELSLSDLPVELGNQIRVQFHASGNADLLVDDIDLCDLRFDDQRRSELVKRVYAAKTALGDHQVVDCLRLVNEYWSRYLVEYVPPVEREPVVLAKQNPATEEAPEESRQKVGSRLRKLVPKIWR
ncbi:hypothetical protein Pla144_20630 [Bythopirellula polymerisocia]|uniref:Glycosyl hydrolase-like 10 domain-containing protein n=2 Tax=Bythopirellula polymerisocia TaxID=2528003 RepID=A0A5C6CV27_9BACT|nr:hypothetical protein Pla144_20630 [Bythopirellula polymerisocia]